MSDQNLEIDRSDELREKAVPYFAAARERHSIYLKRLSGEARPWTQDPIYNRYKFTNVFRELDRTTVWFKENVRDHYASSPTCRLATLVFRLFNRIETGRALFGQGDFFGGSPFNVFSEANLRFGANSDPHVAVQDLKKAILAGVKSGGPYVTGSYIIKTPQGLTKLDGVLWIIAEALRGEMKVRGSEKPGRVSLYDWGKYMLETGEPIHLETACSWLERLPYIGHFTAYEIISDLRWTKLLNRAPDIMTWANPGPGCRRGIKRVIGGDKKAYIGNDAQILKMLRGLLALSQEEEYWPKSWQPWEMREVEHWCCEFDKYERARLGEGRPRGTYP